MLTDCRGSHSYSVTFLQTAETTRGTVFWIGRILPVISLSLRLTIIDKALFISEALVLVSLNDCSAEEDDAADTGRRAEAAAADSVSANCTFLWECRDPVRRGGKKNSFFVRTCSNYHHYKKDQGSYEWLVNSGGERFEMTISWLWSELILESRFDQSIFKISSEASFTAPKKKNILSPFCIFILSVHKSLKHWTLLEVIAAESTGAKMELDQNSLRKKDENDWLVAEKRLRNDRLTEFVKS